jgi:hypothetical protein
MEEIIVHNDKIPKNKESTRYFSATQEDYVRDLVHGVRTSNSGAGHFVKGDVVVPKSSTLIECKTPMSSKSSFSIKKEWIDKNKDEAFSQRMSYGAIAFEFEPNGKNYFVIDESLFQYLMKKLEEDEQ